MLCWIVGFAEHIVPVKEHEKSMNKMGVRNYPYFFALNFTVPKDSTKDWFEVRLKVLNELLNKIAFTER